MKAKQLIGYACWLSLAGLLVSSLPVIGQTSVFTYQGRLTFQGYSANGNYDLTFKLFDALENGSQIGSTITNANLSVSNGLFTVSLDFGSGGFPGADRWLELGVRTNGSSGEFATLAPRQQMTASPYAVTAAGFTGTVQDSQLSANVARTNQANTFYGEVKATVGGVDYFMVPKGVVLLWSGSSSGIPSGWAICDGTGGTPDLRDKFIVGAGSAYAVGATGGATSHSHATTATTASAGAHTHITDPASFTTTGGEGAHTHAVDVASFSTGSAGAHTHTTDLPAHSHGGGTLDFARAVGPGGSGYSCSGGYSIYVTTASSSQTMNVCWNGATATYNPAAAASSSNGAHTHTVDAPSTTSGSAGGHNHAVDVPASASNSNGDHAHDVSVTNPTADSRPPYYALCYIMKL